MKRQIIESLIASVLILGIITAVSLGIKSCAAEDFCQGKGYDTGRYKAYDGGHYSCASYTRYTEDGVKKDGED